MSTNLGIRLQAEAVRTLAFGAISGTYAALGSALLNPARIYYILNTTDGALTFSWNGTTDHFVVNAGGFLLLDVTTNRSDTGGMCAIAQGTVTWVKGTATSGSVYLSVFYGV